MRQARDLIATLKWRTKSYQTLKVAEKKYHASKLECLALKWSVYNRFRDYLYYLPHLHVHIYNNPVSYVTASQQLTATGQSWVNEKAEITFSIHYKPTKINVIADALSQTPKTCMPVSWKHTQQHYHLTKWKVF